MTEKTVLICDDEPLIREAMSFSVKKEGHKFIMASDGEVAFQKAAEARPDLILLDVGMPVMNGYEVCEKLRALPGGDDFIIIIVTAFGQASDQEKAKSVGANDYITKPFSPRDLQKRIHDLLS